MVANTFKKNTMLVSNTTAATAGVLDMKSFDPKRTDPDNIAEKLRLEETKAQLASAREGMEREAAKLKQQRDQKQQTEKTSSIWIAPSLRASAISRTRMGTTSQKLDVQDEQLFPDLAAADKILEKKEKDDAPKFKVVKKTPVGGGASWASKASTTTKKSEPIVEAETVVVQESAAELNVASSPVEESELVVKEEIVASSNVSAAVDTAVVEAANGQPPAKKIVTKKKKKDLTTFKVGP
jgi:hypothetical protein